METRGRAASGAAPAPAATAPAAARADEDAAARRALIDTLRRWTGTLGIRGLGTWGVGRPDIDRLVRDSRGSSMRTNPIELADAEVAAVIAASL